jgi:hypothetical protein
MPLRSRIRPAVGHHRHHRRAVALGLRWPGRRGAPPATPTRRATSSPKAHSTTMPPPARAGGTGQVGFDVLEFGHPPSRRGCFAAGPPQGETRSGSGVLDRSQRPVGVRSGARRCGASSNTDAKGHSADSSTGRQKHRPAGERRRRPAGAPRARRARPANSGSTCAACEGTVNHSRRRWIVIAKNSARCRPARAGPATAPWCTSMNRPNTKAAPTPTRSGWCTFQNTRPAPAGRACQAPGRQKPRAAC